MDKRYPFIDKKACCGCFVCAENCPTDSLAISEPLFHGDISTIAYLKNRESCIGCGICVKVCPIRAIEMKGESDV